MTFSGLGTQPVGNENKICLLKNIQIENPAYGGARVDPRNNPRYDPSWNSRNPIFRYH